MGLLLGVALLSGPLFPYVDLGVSDETPNPGFCKADGDASITVRDVPLESFRLEQRRFGVEKYYVTGADSTAYVEDVTGCPVLVYRLTIADLNYFSQRLYYLPDSEGQEVSMSPVEGTFDPGEIDQRSYDATLTILLRGDERRTIYRENLTIRTES